jgi:hypothetical protein
VQGICDRDRSVHAGRSHFLIASLSFYILLGDCQGVVGHREQDFDTGAHLSCICLWVTDNSGFGFILTAKLCWYNHGQARLRRYDRGAASSFLPIG